MNKTLGVALAATLALPAFIMADDAAPAATAAPTAAAAAPADASKTAAAAMPAVAKSDEPGSLKKGNDLLDAGKDDEAAAYFMGIGEQSSKIRETYRQLDLSTALLMSGKFDDAATAAQKAIDGKADLSSAWNNLAAAQAQSGKRDDAIATYTKAIATLKDSKQDTSKLEANLSALQAAEEAGKPKKVREADAKATEVATKAAAAAAAAPTAAPAAASPAAAAADSK